METVTFWKPQPRAPWRDWRTWGMLIPIMISAFGFFGTGIFAFAFSDIEVIPSVIQSWLVIVSSGLIVWGAELNTPFCTIEVFRKILRQEHNNWDLSALTASLVGTVVNLLVTFASRLRLDPVWRLLLLNWGPLLAGFAVVCDYYGSTIEIGFLFGSYEKRFETWLTERETWRRENGIVQVGNGGALAELKARLAEVEEKALWPVARKADFENVVKRTNGQMTAERLEMELARDKMKMPSAGTVRRWLS